MQNYQGPGLLRVSSAVSPSTPSPNTPQTVQPPNQPWLASGSQGKPPLPSPSYRQSVPSQSLQQRSHIQQQQQHSLPMTSQQQHISSFQQQQQQPSPSQQTHEHYGQQVPQSRAPQSLTHQQQTTRVQSPANQKLSTPASVQPNTVQPGSQNRIVTTEIDETCNRILSKRSIHELVNQVSHVGPLLVYFELKYQIRIIYLGFLAVLIIKVNVKRNLFCVLGSTCHIIVVI